MSWPTTFPIIPRNNPSHCSIEKEASTLNLVDTKEQGVIHNTYSFEKQLYGYIARGNLAQLTSLLQSTPTNLQVGIMSDSPLRQSKNLFISNITKVGILGAIPGGLDVESTYQLIDTYINKCEKMFSIEEIKVLNYAMLLDFCTRVSENNIPNSKNNDLMIAIEYARNNTNSSIQIDDIARHVGKSASYLTKKFKNELGITLGAFIIRCKLEEAKSLLRYSSMSLSEISNYLCFSSQAYFQNVFKKHFGVTPLRYRNQVE